MQLPILSKIFLLSQWIQVTPTHSTPTHSTESRFYQAFQGEKKTKYVIKKNIFVVFIRKRNIEELTGNICSCPRKFIETFQCFSNCYIIASLFIKYL